MITAEFFRDGDNGRIDVCIRGHAGAVNNGADPVCAAASALVFTFLDTVKALYGEGAFEKEPTIGIGNGFAVFELWAKKALDNTAANALTDRQPPLSLRLIYSLEFLKSGFVMLSKSFPAYVCVLDRES